MTGVMIQINSSRHFLNFDLKAELWDPDGANLRGPKTKKNVLFFNFFDWYMQKYIKTSRKLKIQRKSLQFSIIFPPFYYGKSKVTKLSQRLNPLKNEFFFRVRWFFVIEKHPRKQAEKIKKWKDNFRDFGPLRGSPIGVPYLGLGLEFQKTPQWV